MERGIFKIVVKYFILLLITEIQLIESSKLGHYRCSWHFGPAPSEVLPANATVTEESETKKSECTSADSSRITSFVNHCSKQNYVPLLACREDRTWNCQSFIAMCKTLIHTESMAPDNRLHQPSPTGARDQITTLSPMQAQKDSERVVNPEAKMFNPNENYFTMKEMAIAVLVSFIAGATMLAIVICVVWRCRNSHMSSEQAREAAHQGAKRLAALHAITHIAHAIGGGQEGMQPCNFSNPQYGQIIASRDILGDALMEHDRVYEEIFSRRKSSCKSSDCIYANIDYKIKRKKPTIKQNSSTGDLRTIDESAEESDFGYEADNNATPQIPRRKINYWGNVINNNNRSPVMNASRYTDRLNADDLLRNSGSKTSVENTCKSVNFQIGADSEDEASKASKCDSGYMEEVSDSGHVTIKLGDDTDEVDIEKMNVMQTGERKQSLRM